MVQIQLLPVSVNGVYLRIMVPGPLICFLSVAIFHASGGAERLEQALYDLQT